VHDQLQPIVFFVNGKISPGGVDYWADYPGFAVDEEAV